jgi:hypothetical protein
MSAPQLDWSQAEVKNGKLTVSVAGDPPRGWKDTFERTARLLSNGEWDDVTLKKHGVRVDGLQPGSEEKLRFFLESVVQQANATHEPPEDEPREAAEHADEATGASERDTSTDAEMTERFRSFA